MRIEKGKEFGSSDRVACPVCGASMYLIRRTPHSDFGLSFERQTFRPQIQILGRLLPVNRSVERDQRIQISRRVVTDQIDRPCAKQDEGRSNGDDGGTDHGGASASLENTAA